MLLPSDGNNQAFLSIYTMQDTFKQQLLQASPKEKVGLLNELFHTRGQGHYDELVTQYQHAVQAAHLAKATGDTHLVAAALLHDIAHLFEDAADDQQDLFHEDIGADFLSAFYPESVTEPIRLHVPAKRYLCTIDPTYYDELSPASKTSFRLQGGMMSDKELAAFHANPYYRAAVELRRWDDLAKDTEGKFPEIEAYSEDLLAAMK